MSWKDKLMAVAPTLATALGGPAAGLAVKALAKATGLSADVEEKDLAKYVNVDNPQVRQAILKAENEFKIEMERLGVQVYELTVKDKDSARQNHSDSNVPAILSGAITLLVAAIVAALFYFEPPAGAREVLFMLLGVVVKEWSNSCHYWYGTTRGSQQKDKRR